MKKKIIGLVLVVAMVLPLGANVYADIGGGPIDIARPLPPIPTSAPIVDCLDLENNDTSEC